MIVNDAGHITSEHATNTAATPDESAAQSDTSSSTSSSPSGLRIGLGVGISLGVVLLLAIIVILWFRHGRHNAIATQENEHVNSYPSMKQPVEMYQQEGPAQTILEMPASEQPTEVPSHEVQHVRR